MTSYEKVDYTTSVMGDSWLLLVNYSHTTPNFLVRLASSSFPITDNELLILTIIGITVLVIVGALIYLIKKRKTNQSF